jgi:hypothetical protein
MTEPEMLLFTELLFAHRRLWMTFQAYRYLEEHPQADWEYANQIFWEQSHEVYSDLAEALNDEQPIRDKLQTVLLQSHLAETEIRDQLKKNHG